MNAEKSHLKTLTATIAIAAALGLVATLLMLPWAPLKPVVRHVNPMAEAEQIPLSSFMTLLVRGAFDSLIEGNYTAAAEMLKTLGTAYIPEKYRFVISRFTQLLNKMSDLLSDVEALLDQAEALIAIGKGEDAKALLPEASLKLASANVTYTELRSACNELAKTFSLPMGDVRDRVDELGRVISDLHLRLLRLLEMIERQTMLEDSFLTIDVTPKTVWTGGSILVSGRLYTASGALGGRSVQVYVDGVKLAEAITLNNGEFNIRASIPYLYKPKVAIQARYTPAGLDSQAYKPSASNTVEVSLLYIKPRITAEVVGEALPGKAFILKGYVEADGSLPYSNVKVSWAGTILNASLKDRSFEMLLYTPETLPDGEYALTVETPAWQVYAQAEAKVKVRVYRLPLNVKLQPPTIVFAGAPLALKGEIIYGSERFNVTIRAVFADQAYTTSSSGEFNIGLAVPLTVLTGYQSYEVHVSPEPPWYSNVALSGSIMIINPLMLLVPVGLVSTLTLKLLRGRVEGAKPKGTPQEQVAQHSAAEKEHFVSSSLEWLIDLYWQAAAIIVNLTGVEMKPSMTMREYLAATGPWLGGLKASFEALTAAAERAVYSPAVPSSWLESARKAFEELTLAYVNV